ncbi:MAG: hypothetical protein Q7R49_00720 [Candidatus Daviesbacteria bacterium]|nr:hypothetical protein [Candidatus Daviesbacteria bacterium]
MNDLMQQQDLLQKEGYNLLEKCQLIETLEEIGQTSIVGSLQTGLMTWRDIDIEVVVNKIDKEDARKVIDHVINYASRRVDFSIIDNTALIEPHHPKGLYLGIRYELATQKTWKIDIWFLDNTDSHANEYTLKLKERLTDESRQIILDIKSQIDHSPKYAKEIYSTDIYDAVLDKGVKSLDEFKEYLKKLGKSLE